MQIASMRSAGHFSGEFVVGGREVVVNKCNEGIQLRISFTEHEENEVDEGGILRLNKRRKNERILYTSYFILSRVLFSAVQLIEEGNVILYTNCSNFTWRNRRGEGARLQPNTNVVELSPFSI